ncbi:hypothetical protein RUM44_002745 [Polyplax serrata]|uniref:Dual specificity protein phosphatase n=1 Tax=Polyplax serrata TaxID=468196 RepID=A0ABR1AFM0_POLSC
MSLLEQIITNKGKLQSVETVTSTLFGNKFIEKVDKSGQISKQKVLGTCPGFVMDNKLDLQIAQILNYLYLGSQDPAQDSDLLEKNGITHVLSIGVDLPQKNLPNCHFQKVELLDEPGVNMFDALQFSINFINNVIAENGNNKIFVHCNAGYSRAPAIIIGYLMKTLGLSLQEALCKVNEKRKVKPNDGFLRQLKELEQQLRQQ